MSRVPTSSPPAPDAKPGQRVLVIVDPSKNKFQELIKSLQGSNIHVEFISTKDNFVPRIIELKPDILLMNLFINNASTLPYLTEIKNGLGRLACKILMLTGHHSVNNIREALKAGADDFVLEPFDSRLLLQRIRYQLQDRAIYTPEELRAEPTQVAAGFQLVYDCLRILSDVRDNGAALYQALKQVADLSKSTRVNLIEGDLETNQGFVAASSDDEKLHDLPIDLEKYPEVREVLMNGAIVNIKDITQNPLTKDITAQVKTIKINSLIVFPVRHRSETMGAMSIRLSNESGLEVTDKHLKTFYMVALAIGPKFAARKLLRRYQKGGVPPPGTPT